ncbi:phosphoheptose isomerase [Kribbella qitaiheensis]|uniref:phosphoheptose isomerase n=1 Tax=Kribbella qitaiheensis TaxID=1544730 RepID=UPI001FE31FDE|nr:phosphoheptose isomerase [Kribbella qitaiheensis]
MSFFDDSRLDDPAALQATDHLLRRLAGAGARVRAEIEFSSDVLSNLGSDGFRPRAIVAAGRDARLVRAVLEPVCPVPFVAWPGPGLPGWASPLDLVIVLGGTSEDSGAMSAASEAVRRGCGLMVASPEDSPVAQASAGSRHAIRLPSQSDDQLAAAVAVLQGLHQLELGPAVDADAVAAMLDEVAIECSPNNDVASNPAKDLSLMLADALPLVWGGSVLAARAARRVVEAMRLASGRPALAGRRGTPAAGAGEPGAAGCLRGSLRQAGRPPARPGHPGRRGRGRGCDGDPPDAAGEGRPARGSRARGHPGQRHRRRAVRGPDPARPVRRGVPRDRPRPVRYAG